MLCSSGQRVSLFCARAPFTIARIPRSGPPSYAARSLSLGKRSRRATRTARLSSEASWMSASASCWPSWGRSWSLRLARRRRQYFRCSTDV
eukprot:9483373-Alexandrium_andersonii.AAC.1